MRYYRTPSESGDRLIAYDSIDAYDLTSVTEELRTFADLAAAAHIAGQSLDTLASNLLERADVLDMADVSGRIHCPLDPDEVWAAGVTYEISEEARESESGMPEMYVDVYDNDRPELFFKATANRTVGPYEPIGIRGDSSWNVPEPELAVVLFRGSVIGFTIGNDVSSRAIEGANPLYLPQAKVYTQSCAIGPCIASTSDIPDPHDLSMSMEISRDDEIVFYDTTSTGEMVRSIEELVSSCQTHNIVPRLSVLLTGTSLVPPDEFTLQDGDTVYIEIDGIGTLENSVEEV